MLADRQTHKQTDRQADRNTPLPCRCGVITWCGLMLISAGHLESGDVWFGILLSTTHKCRYTTDVHGVLSACAHRALFSDSCTLNNTFLCDHTTQCTSAASLLTRCGRCLSVCVLMRDGLLTVNITTVSRMQVC